MNKATKKRLTSIEEMVSTLKNEFSEKITQLEKDQSTHIKNLITLVNFKPEAFKSKSVLDGLLNGYVGYIHPYHKVFVYDYNKYRVEEVLNAPEKYGINTIKYTADMVNKARLDDDLVARHKTPQAKGGDNESHEG